MAFALDPKLPLPRALSVAALAELDAALAAIARDDERGVHEARKSCKRLRAWLRLLRGPLRADYVLLNRLVRDAARQLAPRREAAVGLDTLRSLRRSGALDAALWQRLGRALRAHLTPTQEESESASSAASQLLATARVYLEALDLGALSLEQLRATLARNTSEEREAYAEARTVGSAERLHEWRKQVKYHGYQRNLLGPLAGPRPRKLALLDRLSDALGRHHDLHVLQDQLERLPATYHGTQAWRLHEAIRGRQLRLERQALRLGERLFGVAGTVSARPARARTAPSRPAALRT
ncbi:MAG TPA: CHAD domain-containing protein [Solimonas sp.]|nr:CHAD domain-containing protein [Solimonas sp.]